MTIPSPSPAPSPRRVARIACAEMDIGGRAHLRPVVLGSQRLVAQRQAWAQADTAPVPRH